MFKKPVLILFILTILFVPISVMSESMGSSSYNVTGIVTSGGSNSSSSGYMSLHYVLPVAGNASSSSYDTTVGQFFSSGGNSAPIVSSVTLNATTVYNYSADNLFGYCNASDGDGDPLSYKFKWYKNGGVNMSGTLFKGGSVSAGGYHSCGIRASDSRVLCWGQNNNGQLGTGNTTDQSSPTLTSDSSAYISVSASDEHSCGIRANDSRVLCWGNGNNGRLGTGDVSQRLNPTLIDDTSAYSMIATGYAYQHSCGIRASDSRVLCWGRGTNGRLGNGDTVQRESPTLTSDSSAYSFIEVGAAFSCGIRASDSRVLCWGQNNNGQLGTGNTTDMHNPTLINDSSAYIDLGLGFEFGCGIRASDSRVLCWGDDLEGYLGNGAAGESNNPVLTSDPSAYLIVSSGPVHSCGIRANDSRVLCWGSGNNGRLGDGGTGVNYVPTLVNDSSSYLDVSGGQHSCGIRANDSRVLCWGQNADGQLGLGNEDSPVLNPSLTVDPGSYTVSRIDNLSSIGPYYHFNYMDMLASVFAPIDTFVDDEFIFSCMVSDGLLNSIWVNSSAVMIISTPPVVSSVRISPDPATATDTLEGHCTATDYDADNVSYHWKWYKDDVLNESGSEVHAITNHTQGTEVNVDNLTSGIQSFGENWTFSCLAYDGTSNSTLWSNYSVIINTPPDKIVLSAPESGNTTTNRSPMFSWVEGTDGEADPLTYYLNLTCGYSGGGTDCSDDNSETVVEEGNCTGDGFCNFTVPFELKYFGDDNYYYNWTVRAYDQNQYGQWSDVWNITIYTSVVITLYNDSMQFGVIGPGQNNDTSDDSPEPFKIRNDGNCFVDINISSTDLLWDSQPTASDYFRYMVDNVTGEENSLNWSSQNTTSSWTPIPVVNGSAMSFFNYSDATDEAEIEVYISVPTGEMAGIKTSTMWFTAGYNSEYE